LAQKLLIKKILVKLTPGWADEQRNNKRGGTNTETNTKNIQSGQAYKHIDVSEEQTDRYKRKTDTRVEK
jgi:hypothetical protein